MFHIPLVTGSSNILLENFWNAILLYHNRPHLINRRLTGVVTIFFCKVFFNNANFKRLGELFTRSVLLYEIRKLEELSSKFITQDLFEQILKIHDKNAKLIETTLEDFIKSGVDDESIYISVRILYPRHSCYEKTVEVVTLDKKCKLATFLGVTDFDKKPLAPVFPYDVHLDNNGSLRVCIEKFEHAEDPSADWLVDGLFPKLVKWAENYEPGVEVQQSLSLIPVEKYTEMYHNLKLKYGINLVKIWPEKTDPLKFVYEDVAIATYLILLWKQTNTHNKPSFVDLGCGNGLLVHILNEEGYPGCGIDVRKRKIWNLYPPTICLKEQTITPSAKCLFSSADWIIGNHSDELTPWIPVITARSSPKTNFFLLPCCCYEFNGKKYRRANSSVSTYNDYLDYIRYIANRCGFIIKTDKLRIPSTKRTCIISFGRNYEMGQTTEVDMDISNLISEKCNNQTHNNNDEKLIWTNDFLPRLNSEKVRNCTQLNSSVIVNFVNKIAVILLADTYLQNKADGSMWNRGGTISLPNLVKMLEKKDLKQLKNECGGLQTLLKNHRYIFEVSGGLVKLRIPSLLVHTNGKYKSKTCWFYKNHPNGCLHDEKECAYQHV